MIDGESSYTGFANSDLVIRFNYKEIIPDEPDEPDEPTVPNEPSVPNEPAVPDEPSGPDVPQTGDTLNWYCLSLGLSCLISILMYKNKAR